MCAIYVVLIMCARYIAAHDGWVLRVRLCFCNFAFMNDSIPSYNNMQLVKRRFFAMRNGVISDALRKAGSPYHIIFGVNLPQIREIASQFTPSADLAQRLWADTRTRESALLAPWLIPGRMLSLPEAEKWISSATSTEAIDILCMACLRNTGYAGTLAQKLSNSEKLLDRYASMRVMMNNLNKDTAETAGSIAAKFSNDENAALRMLAMQLADEIEWIS